MSLPRASIGLACALCLIGRAPTQSPPFARMDEAIPPGNWSWLCMPGDLDGDGDLDLLRPDRVALENDAGGRFLDAGPIAPVSAGDICAVGDFDGDGLADAIANRQAQLSGEVTRTQVLLNQGGVLSPAGLIAPSYGPPLVHLNAIILGDFDGDADLDAVVVPNGLPLRLWLNDGSGGLADATFQFASPWTPYGCTAAYGPPCISALDIDGDGDLDLFMFDGLMTPTVMPNNGGAIFGLPLNLPGTIPGWAWTGDFDGDNLPDILRPRGNGIDVFRNLGGTFAPPLPFSGPVANSLGLIDLDGDGKDEVVRFMPESIIVHDVDSAGIVPAPRQTLAVLALAPMFVDVDGDQDRDVLALTAQGARLILNTGGVLVLVDAPLTTPLVSGPVGLADMDADGDTDLVVTSPTATAWTATPWTAWNDGRGRLAWEALSSCAGICDTAISFGSPMAVFDADGDGLPDAYVTDVTINTPAAAQDRLYLNRGTGFVALPGVPWIDRTSCLEHGDLDGDGDQDLVTAALSLGQPARIMLSAGSGAFLPPVFLTGIHRTEDLSLADLDGDGDLDIVQANDGPGDGCLWRPNAGGGAFPLEITIAEAAGQVETGDLDGDGDVDLLLDLHLWLNDGGGGFRRGGSLPAPPPSPFWAPLRTLLVDADSDGDLDIVAGTGSFYRNQGPAVFGPVEPFPVDSGFTRLLLAADLDGDGDQDLVTDGPRILANLTRHLGRGRIARSGRTMSLEIHGPPGAPFLLWAGTSSERFDAPPYGRVFIDPWTSFLAAAGTLDGSGRRELSFAVPGGAALTGTRIFWQAAAGESLTNGQVTPVLP